MARASEQPRSRLTKFARIPLAGNAVLATWRKSGLILKFTYIYFRYMDMN
jgi:hypothetical protein